jgi:hypothetical protein
MKKFLNEHQQHIAMLILIAATTTFTTLVYFGGKSEGTNIDTARQIVADDLGKCMEYQTMLQQMLNSGAGKP